MSELQFQLQVSLKIVKFTEMDNKYQECEKVFRQVLRESIEE